MGVLFWEFLIFSFLSLKKLNSDSKRVLSDGLHLWKVGNCVPFFKRLRERARWSGPVRTSWAGAAPLLETYGCFGKVGGPGGFSRCRLE